MNIEESARLAGGYCWVERRLFEVLGSWVGLASAPESKVVLDRHSLHAAWRAGQWFERLPVRAGVEREALVEAPAGWGGALFGAVGEADAGRDSSLLGVAYRVWFPRLAVAYGSRRAHLAGPSDGPLRRTLEQGVSDLLADWLEGEAALEAVLVGSADLEAAQEALGRAERPFVV